MAGILPGESVLICFRAHLINEVRKAYDSEADFRKESDESLLLKLQVVPYYEALKLKPGAPATEIRKAYRELNKQLHPDKTKGEENKEGLFVIQTAYKRLGESSKVLGEELSELARLEEENNPAAKRWRKPVHDEL